MANNKINFQVGFSVDKSGLSQMQSLFQQIAFSAQEPGNKLNTELQQAAKTASTLDGILSRTFNTELGTLNVTKFNQELKNSGLTLKTVQSDFSKIGTQGADAYNRLAQAVLGTNQQLKQSSKLLNDMFTTFKNTVRYSISSSIFNNMSNSIQKAYDYTKQLDTSLNDIRIVTDKSSESMADFAQQANEAAKSLGASTLDYTNASLIYYQQGLSDAEVAARAETTIKAANVTGQTGEEVSEQLTAVWNGYKVTASETELYVDKLAAVAATTAADLEELSTGMSKVASAANAMGVDFDDLNAQIATIVSVTRQAPESVGTALKTIYARLGDLKVDGVDEFGVSLGEVSSQMVQMGIQILDQEGNLRDMSSVIAEVAEKWTGWTEAQRQAAAVAMAGKRQYNNLIALFDNWDMYTEALNTSTEAVGTLQHQQDIYMESTAAKLKTLKAAWQGLYDDAINEDEVNAGIEALTNLVEVFDNFIDSFGGGIKAIGGFGAIISSIFNKQIADSINAANQRIQVFKNNLELAKTANDIRQKGAQEAGDTARSQAIQANTEAQIQYSQKIYDARLGLSQEQANTLINLQKEIGQTQELLTLDENRIKRFEQKVSFGEEDLNFIKQYAGNLDEINWKYEDQEELIKKQLDEASKLLQTLEELDKDERFYVEDLQEAKDLHSQLDKLAEGLNNEEKQSWSALSKELITVKDFQGKEEEILETVRQIVDANKTNLSNTQKQADAARKLSGMYSQMYSNQSKNNSAKQQADDMLKAAQSASTFTQQLTTVTSSLGNMAMAWSSVNSLIDTWSDEQASFGDKLTQTFMTLGMTIPMVISNFNKLNEAISFTESVTSLSILKTEAQTAAQAANNAMTLGAITLKQDKVDAVIAEMTAEELETVVTEKGAAADVVQAAAERAGVAVKKNYIKAIIAKVTAQKAETAATKAQTAAQLGLAGIIGTVVVATIAFAIKKYEEYIQAQIDSNNKIIESSNAIQEEANANQELYDSYNKLYNQYKNNEVKKEALYDITDELIEKYNLEEGYLAKLTGNYDDLTKAIKKAREEEIKAAKQSAENEVKASKNNLLPMGQQTDQGRRYGETYQVGFDYGFVRQEVDKRAEEYIKKYVKGSYSSQNGILVSEVDGNDPESIVTQYEQIAQAVEEMDTWMSDTDRSASEVYQNAKKYVDSMTETVEQYKTALQDLDDYNVQLSLIQHNIEGIQSFDEYTEKVEAIRKELLDEFNGDSEKVNSLLNTYLSSLDNEFVQIGFGLEQLKEELNMDDEEFNKLLDWSDEDKKLLFSGLVEFDGLKTEEDLRKALDNAKNALSEEDLTVAVSLRSKISSTKTLTKAEIEEAAGEESTLAQDYELELSDFDNQSQLKQVETLNDIVNDKIAINKRYIENAKEAAQEEKEVLEERKKNWESEKRSLEGKKSAPGVEFTDEDKARLEELESMILQTTDEITDLQEIINKGLSFEDIDDINFDNIVDGLDGVVSMAEVLKDLAEDVGENWTIAAEDIENFALNFPELLSEQENYNTLQDGSIQLTKQGQEVFNGLIETRKADLQLQNEAYQLELQKQIDIQEATAEYYENQAEQLQAYLDGKKSGAETEVALEEGVNKYIQDLSEITGQDSTELSRVIQDNQNNARENNTLNAQKIYDNYVAIGSVAAAASEAYLSGQFADPGLKPSAGGGGTTSVSTYKSSKRDLDSGSYLKGLSDDAIQSMIDDALAAQEKAENRAAQLIAKKASLGASVNAATNAMTSAAAGKGGKDSSSGGGSSSEDRDKELKQLEEEFDRYWEINKALDSLDRQLKKIDKDQENLYGKELIRSLKQENELLANQTQLYEQLAAAQQQEAAELRGTLSSSGVVFDASGAIVNYAQATAAALQEYNDAVTAYNNGLLDDAALEIHEQKFEQFKEDLERYDTLFYTEMQDTMEKIDDLRRQTLENNLKAWETEIQLKLDTEELERDWNDFLKEITKDFQSVFKDLRVDLNSMVSDALSYASDDGTINTTIDAIHDVTSEIDKLMNGGTSDMFESVSQAQEKLKELNEQLIDAGQALHDLWEEAWDSYLEGIDQVADKFDDLIDRFETINDELEFQGKLIELLYGDEAYELMSKLYEGQEKSTENQIQSLKTQADMWEDLFYSSGATLENQSSWTEDQKKYYEEWQEAQSSLNNLVIDYIELLQKDYLNTISDILSELEESITGSSLEDINTEWERISANADKYYDSVEGAYYIQTLANKIDQSIASTTSLKAQQKLMELREKEISYLQEKENLTEYDIQAAELRYQIALKEIALEEAQNNKTSMKLTRNEQGNWSYQYVADEDDIATKQQELLDAYNNLYQLASDAYESNLESLQELQEKYLESAEEIAADTTLTEEEKQQKLYDLRQWYLEQYQILAEENQLYRNDLATSGAGLLLKIYSQDQKAYESMTEYERGLIDALVKANVDDYMTIEEKLKENYQNIGDKAKEVMSETRLDWTSGAQTLADLWNKDSGSSVKSQIVQAYNAIIAANLEYQNKLDQLAITVERDFSEEGISGAIKGAADKTDDLKDKTIEMASESVNYLNDLKMKVNEIEEAWEDVQDDIQKAIDLIKEYLQKSGEASTASSQSTSSGGSSGSTSSSGSSSSGGSSGGSSSSSSSSTSAKHSWAVYNPATGSNAALAHFSSEAEAKAWVQRNGGKYYQEYDTGGYTGSWGDSSGRIAMLHQKELVLNADDTSNFLSAISTIRDLNSSVGGSIQDAVLKAVANTALSLGAIKTNGVIGNIANNNSSTDNVFNITAEFPNANSVDDIREAILSLPNLASQYANSTLK